MVRFRIQHVHAVIARLVLAVFVRVPGDCGTPGEEGTNPDQHIKKSKA